MKVLTLFLFLFCGIVEAQTYPVKPIRIIVPLVPGGNQDIMARAVAEEVSKGLGQQIVVENRPGQSAIIGTRAVKASAPDGYTLLSVAITFARVPARSVQELIALARSQPGQLSYATSGNGSTGHVAGEMFMRRAGIRMLHVPYKGNAQSLVDVMGGQVAMMFDQVSTSAAHIKAGKLRALGVTTLTRSPLFPDVPTLDESGLTGFEDVTWNGYVAPAGTPREVLTRLHAEIARAVSQPEFRQRYLERGIETRASASPEGFSAYIRSEAAAFAALAREAGIKAE